MTKTLTKTVTNQEISRRLREHATALSRGGENLYRVRAFRHAAMAVLALPVEVVDLVAGRNGRKALENMPGIGKSLADTIVAFCMSPPNLPTAGAAA
jgi:DNA polymerase (family 10)